MSVACLVAVTHAGAQVIEATGERALGMGGAFTAVANDSSATWWNPAGLADGPFFDLTLSRAVVERQDVFPAGRDRATLFTLSTPVVGVSVQRLGAATAAVQRPGTAPALVSWSGTVVGATLVQTLVEGTHVGATVKYVRGRTGVGGGLSASGPEEAVEQAAQLQRASAEGQLELDLGALSVAGPVRLGFVVRNVRSAGFEGGFTLPRQARVGVAFAAEQVGGPPLTIAVDADLRAYRAGDGERRVLAVGAEQWVMNKRVGLRAGARANRVGARERAFTVGASIALRPGQFVEAHVVGAGTPGERGWGTGIRVSF